MKSTAIKSAGAQEWIGAGVPVSGCGCVQWDAIFARRQLFCVYAFGFFFFFNLFRGKKGKVQAKCLEVYRAFWPNFGKP